VSSVPDPFKDGARVTMLSLLASVFTENVGELKKPEIINLQEDLSL
jgi:hypothetical protein